MIRLAQLAHLLDATVDVDGGVGTVGEIKIVDVEHNSRLVDAGALFACVRGATSDGHDFAQEAVQRGAVALLVERPVPSPVPNLIVNSVRRAMGPASAAVHEYPSERLDVVGVTGTNGKTTTVRLIAEILTASGLITDEIGTLTGARTTPEAPELQRSFAAAVGRGDNAVAMEVSSHALDQYRVDGTRFRVAAFTNLGRDHLDHHGTVEAYFESKVRLFDALLSDNAVVHIGSDHGRRLADAVSIPLVEVGPDTAEIVGLGPRVSRFRWRGEQIELPLGGVFNVANAVVAAEVAIVLGIDPVLIAKTLGEVPQVPGRFESVEAGQDFTVIVDYAHTPEGLEAVLAAARQVTDRHLMVVFGAGGDRDRQKRPRMGAVASTLADHAIVTSDNPRSEDPDKIIDDITAGMSEPPDLIEPDRRLAIRHAIAGARTGDVVVITGKGHESTQTIGNEIIDFDDRLVARDELARRGARGT